MKRRIEVVGAVIVRDRAILCAQRGSGGPLAGLWEFPGGKVETGERPDDALVREIREELACEILVGARLTTTEHEYDFAVILLSTYWCELVTGEPVASEHAVLKWLRSESLVDLEWAPADIPAVNLIVEGGVR